MDISIFLEPVAEKCFGKAYRPGKKTLGETINIYRNEDDFPDLEGVDLARSSSIRFLHSRIQQHRPKRLKPDHSAVTCV